MTQMQCLRRWVVSCGNPIHQDQKRLFGYYGVSLGPKKKLLLTWKLWPMQTEGKLDPNQRLRQHFQSLRLAFSGLSLAIPMGRLLLRAIDQIVRVLFGGQDCSSLEKRQIPRARLEAIRCLQTSIS